MADKYIIQRRTASGLENVAELPALESGKIDLSWLPVVGSMGSAIIERGSNANGEYIRWTDGTQVCRSTLVLTGIDVPETQQVWNGGQYISPASFLNNVYDLYVSIGRGINLETNRAVYLSVAYTSDGILSIWNTGRSPYDVHPGGGVRGAGGTSYNVTSAIIRVVAIGRWK